MNGRPVRIRARPHPLTPSHSLPYNCKPGLKSPFLRPLFLPLSSLSAPSKMPLNAKSIYPREEPEFAQFPSRRSVVHSTKGIVACSQPLAAEAGQRILKQGGNAAVRPKRALHHLCTLTSSPRTPQSQSVSPTSPSGRSANVLIYFYSGCPEHDRAVYDRHWRRHVLSLLQRPDERSTRSEWIRQVTGKLDAERGPQRVGAQAWEGRIYTDAQCTCSHGSRGRSRMG